MAVAVLLEDAAAVIGVVIASACVGLAAWTGNPIFDAIGSILIGVLLGCVAVFLVMKNRSALLGRTIASDEENRVLDVLCDDPVVEGVHDVKSTVMSAESFRFKAEVDFDGSEVARRWLSERDMADIFEDASSSPERLEAFLVEYGEHIVEALGDEIDRIEREIRDRVPGARHLDLEAD